MGLQLLAGEELFQRPAAFLVGLPGPVGAQAQQVEGDEVGRPLRGRLGGRSCSAVPPLLQPFEGELVVLPHHQLAVYVAYHICLINSP